MQGLRHVGRQSSGGSMHTNRVVAHSMSNKALAHRQALSKAGKKGQRNHERVWQVVVPRETLETLGENN